MHDGNYLGNNFRPICDHGDSGRSRPARCSCGLGTRGLLGAFGRGGLWSARRLRGRRRCRCLVLRKCKDRQRHYYRSRKKGGLQLIENRLHRYYHYQLRLFGELTGRRLSTNRCEPKLTGGNEILRFVPLLSSSDTTKGLTGALSETSPARCSPCRIDSAPVTLKSVAGPIGPLSLADLPLVSR